MFEFSGPIKKLTTNEVIGVAVSVPTKCADLMEPIYFGKLDPSDSRL